MERDSWIEIEPAVLAAVERVAGTDGGSSARFINRAILEKLSAVDPAAYFEERAKRAKPGAIREWLAMAGDEPPIPGDEMPEAPPRP